MVGATTTAGTIKFLCSYGGKILPRYPDGKLRYLGGETRVIAVHRSISFAGQFFLFLFLFCFCILYRFRIPLYVRCVYLVRNRIEEWGVCVHRAVGEAGRDVWRVSEPTLPVADGRPGRLGFDHLRRGPRQPRRGVRSGRVAAVHVEDQGLPLPTQVPQENLSFSSVVVFVGFVELLLHRLEFHAEDVHDAPAGGVVGAA